MSIELLAPAGSVECLETALYFGADAVYAAGRRFGLRAFAANFSDEQLEWAARYVRGCGKRLYVTVNAALREAELDALDAFLLFLEKIGVDGIIFSDSAVIAAAKRLGTQTPLHLSTQANVMNAGAAAFWHGQGVKRIVMSREVSLADIARIRKNTPESMELEAFVHGAMCVAYSGRCLLSAFLMARSGNRGECAQPCRWEYHLSERGYDGEYFPIQEDERGAYILNSKDLMMIEHIPELAEAGVTSFKIEGRMKSPYYVASVVNAYRRALDGFAARGTGYALEEGLAEELVKSATRPFTTGFYLGNPREGAQDVWRDDIPRRYTFAAKVTGNARDGFVEAEQRGKFREGQTLEVLSPNLRGASFVVKEIWNEEGERQESAPHPQQRLRINCPFELRTGDILRRADEKWESG